MFELLRMKTLDVLRDLEFIMRVLYVNYEQAKRKRKNGCVKVLPLQGLVDTNIALSSIMKMKSDDLMLFTEHLGLMVMDMFRATSVSDMIMAAGRFISVRTGRPIVSLISDACSKLLKLLQSIPDDLEPIPLQGADLGLDWMTFSRDSVDLWPRIKKCAAFRKIRLVVAYVVSTTVWDDPKAASKLMAVEKKHFSTRGEHCVDMVHSILDLVVFSIERTYQCVVTGSFHPIFHSGGSYEKWYEEATDLLAKSQYLTNPAAHAIDIHNVIEQCNRLINQGESMYKYAAELDKPSKSIVMNTLLKLKVMREEDINSRSTKAVRRCPLAVCVAGHSSVAKTAFTNMLHVFYCMLRNKKRDSSSKFVRNVAAKHWDGFTSDVVTIVFDDIAFENPAFMTTISDSVSELLNIINNTPHTFEMASLEAKGRTPCLNEFLIATTNSPGLHANTYFACPLALARRFKYYLLVTPKSEYKSVDNPTMIDSSKIPRLESESFPDLWNIEVQTPRAGEAIDTTKENQFRTRVKYETIKNFTEIRSFLIWFRDVVDIHNHQQDQVLAADTQLANAHLCEECRLPMSMCSCVNLFRSDVEIPHQGEDIDVDFAICAKCLYLSHQCKCRWYYRLPLQGVAYVQNVFLYICFFFGCMFLYTAAVDYFRRFMNMRLVVKAAELCDRYVDESKLYLKYSYEQSKARLRYLGHKVSCFLKFNPKVVALFSALSVGIVSYLAYRMLRGSSTTPISLQGNGLGRPPDKKREERESCWVKPDYEITSFDFTSQSLSSKGMDCDEFARVLSKNSAYFMWKKNGVCKGANAIGLGGQYWLTTLHTTPVEPEGLQFINGKFGNLNSNINTKVAEQDIQRFPEKDLCIIKLRNVPNRRNIIPYFMKNTVSGFTGKSRILSRTRLGELIHYNVDVLGIRPYIERGIKLSDLWFALPDQNTIDGTCGAPYFAKTRYGFVLLGIHQRGLSVGEKICAAIPVTQEWLEQYVKDVTEPSSPLLDTPSTDTCCISSVNPKSPVNFTEGQALVHGGLVGFRPSHSSKVTRTLLCSSMLKRGFELQHGPPVMKGWRPWQRAFAEISRGDTTMDDSILSMCVDHMVDRWSQVIPEYGDEIHIYDMETVVNGRPGLRFVDKMNRSSSAGAPWRKSKKFLLEYLPSDDVWDSPVKLDDEVVTRVHERLDKYRQGFQTHPMFVSHLKDEAVKKQKILTAKTRVFMASAVDFTVVMRMLLLPFVRVMQINSYVFESAPGMEAQTVAWDHLYHYITQHGTNQMVSGDFKDYDISMRPHVILWAFEAIVTFMRKSGATEEHCRMVESLGFDIAFALVDFNGTLVTLFGKNPSGQALTVVINGIVNCLYMRYCYVSLSPELVDPLRSWNDSIALITYGDDNNIGVSQECPWFNHTAIARVLADCNITYTMADKERQSVPFISIEEVDFLKRKYRYEPELGAVVAPLEIASIHKMLMIGVLSQLTPEAQAIAVARSALDEAFFHGKEVFEFWYRQIHEMIDEQDLSVYLESTPLPTWELLCERWRRNSEAYLRDLFYDNPTEDEKRHRVFGGVIRVMASLPLQGSEEEEILIRPCLHCGRNRFDDYDMDCPHCLQNDVCERCGALSSTIKRRIMPGYMYMSQVCDSCFVEAWVLAHATFSSPHRG